MMVYIVEVSADTMAGTMGDTVTATVLPPFSSADGCFGMQLAEVG